MEDLGGDNSETEGKRLTKLQETVIQLCYEILGVDRNVSLKEIKNAYRNLSRKYYPDRGGDNEVFQAINQAKEQQKMQAG